MPTHKFGGSALLTALYTRITTDALTSTYRTYQVGCVPDGTALPYVTIGGLIGGKSAGFTSRDIKGEDLVCHVHVWSNYEGDTEAAGMMNNISQAITATDLSITGYTTLKGITDYAQVLLDETTPGQLLRHGVIRFRWQIA
jgi:hypothetical protein